MRGQRNGSVGIFARLDSYRFSRRTQHDIVAKRSSWNAKIRKIQIGNTSFMCLPIKSANLSHSLERLFATPVCVNVGRENTRSRNPISRIIVSVCSAYQKRSGVRDARLSFKILHHFSLSLYLWTYIRFSLYSRILSAMTVHAKLRRALCPLLVIRFAVLLFLRPLLSHTLFLVCSGTSMQPKSQALFYGLRKFHAKFNAVIEDITKKYFLFLFFTCLFSCPSVYWMDIVPVFIKLVIFLHDNTDTTLCE